MGLQQLGASFSRGVRTTQKDGAAVHGKRYEADVRKAIHGEKTAPIIHPREIWRAFLGIVTIPVNNKSLPFDGCISGKLLK